MQSYIICLKLGVARLDTNQIGLVSSTSSIDRKTVHFDLMC